MESAAPNTDVKPQHYRLYAEVTGVSSKRLGQLKGDIKRGRCLPQKEAITGYGEYIEAKRKEAIERRDTHAAAIKALRSEHYSEKMRLQREAREKQTETEQFLIDFIKNLGEDVAWRVNDEHYMRFGFTLF
jgi:hypothetical protein